MNSDDDDFVVVALNPDRIKCSPYNPGYYARGKDQRGGGGKYEVGRGDSGRCIHLLG